MTHERKPLGKLLLLMRKIGQAVHAYLKLRLVLCLDILALFGLTTIVAGTLAFTSAFFHYWRIGSWLEYCGNACAMIGLAIMSFICGRIFFKTHKRAIREERRVFEAENRQWRDRSNEVHSLDK